MTNRITGATWFAIFAVAASLAFSSAISAPFEFDDLAAIQQNRTIRSILPLSGPLSPPVNTAVAGRPVVNLTLAINYGINEALGIDQRSDPDGPSKTVGYHVFNILVHVLCAALLFGVIRRTLAHWGGGEVLGSPALVAGLATVLWLLNPVQTEAVDYVVQRTELLVSCFYLATLYASIRAWDAPDATSLRVWYVLGTLACILGMLSKEVMITAPFVVVLYDRAFRADSWRAVVQNTGRRRFYVALFATGLIVIGMAIANVRGASVGFTLGVTWYQYLYTQAWAVARYLGLLAWPAGLTFDYGEAPINGLRGVPGAILLTSLAIATVLAWRRQRWIWLGFLGAWFFIILAPSSSVVPIRTEIAAERRVYLASAAVFVLLVLGVVRVVRRFPARTLVASGALGALAIGFAMATYARGQTYGSPELLYRDVMAKAPDNPRGYAGAGLAVFLAGPARFNEAAILFQEAIAKDSNSFLAWQTLGILQLEQGKNQESLASHEHALRIRPGDPAAMYGAARALVRLRDAKAAIPYVDRVGDIDPDLLWDLGSLLVQSDQGPMAIKYLEPAAAREPHSLGIALLSLAYAQANRTTDAVKTAAAAVSVAGDTAGVFLLAGRAMWAAQHNDEARAYLQRAIVLEPNSVIARQVLDSVNAMPSPRALPRTP